LNTELNTELESALNVRNLKSEIFNLKYEILNLYLRTLTAIDFRSIS